MGAAGLMMFTASQAQIKLWIFTGNQPLTFNSRTCYNHMDLEFLRKDNAILQQRILFLQSQLSQLRSSESTLASKLQQITSSRAAIVQKLNDLSKQYEDKIRQLENKVQKLTRHNEMLIKQGNGYKEEIALFENRILQKERLLTTFVTQAYSAESYTHVDTYVEKPNLQVFEPKVEKEKVTHADEDQQQQKQPPPPPPTMKTIAEEPKKSHRRIQTQKPAAPPPPKPPKTQIRKKSEEKNTEHYATIGHFESSKNVQQSENFFNQLASNSFVSQIVPRDDNPQGPDTPFLQHFENTNFEESQFSESQNFFESLAQSNQFSDPFQSQAPLTVSEHYPQTQQGNSEMKQMMAPPKFAPPKKNRRDKLQVMNPSAFQ